MPRLLILFFACAASRLQAQPSERDSLLHLLRTQPEDTSKIDTYYQYGYLLESTNLDSAVYYFKKAKALAEAKGHIKGQFTFASYYSDVLNLRGQLQESYQVNKQALDLALKHRLPLESAKGSGWGF